jgi:hypothetical protein
MSKEIRHLRHVLIDLLGMMNRPQREMALIPGRYRIVNQP